VTTNIIKWISFLTFLVLYPAGCAKNEEIIRPGENDIKILFIGSSYFDYNDMPGMIKSFAESSGKKVYIERDIINGTYLDDHASSSVTDKKIKEYKWDYVLLQDACTNIGYPDNQHLIFPPYEKHDIHAAIKTLTEKIRQNNIDSKVILMMPWAFEDGALWLKGQTDTYTDMQIKVYDNTIKWANEFDIEIAPVGWAWEKVLEQNTQLHYLYMSDYNHPNIMGSYLSAAVFYCAIFKENVAGNSFISSIEGSKAIYFQRIASSVVLDSLKLWNIK
jgi:hypothetical protein